MTCLICWQLRGDSLGLEIKFSASSTCILCMWLEHHLLTLPPLLVSCQWPTDGPFKCIFPGGTGPAVPPVLESLTTSKSDTPVVVHFTLLLFHSSWSPFCYRGNTILWHESNSRAGSWEYPQIHCRGQNSVRNGIILPANGLLLHTMGLATIVAISLPGSLDLSLSHGSNLCLSICWEPLWIPLTPSFPFFFFSGLLPSHSLDPVQWCALQYLLHQALNRSDNRFHRKQPYGLFQQISLHSSNPHLLHYTPRVPKWNAACRDPPSVPWIPNTVYIPGCSFEGLGHSAGSANRHSEEDTTSCVSTVME